MERIKKATAGAFASTSVIASTVLGLVHRLRRNVVVRKVVLVPIFSASLVIGLAGCSGSFLSSDKFDRETACESTNKPSSEFSLHQSRDSTPDRLICDLHYNGSRVGSFTLAIGPEENRGTYRQECYPVNAIPGLDWQYREDVEDNVDSPLTGCRYLDQNAFQLKSAANNWTAIARLEDMSLLDNDKYALGNMLLGLLSRSHFAGNI